MEAEWSIDAYVYEVTIGSDNGLALGYLNQYWHTVKPVSNDHLYDNIYYLWFIQ